MKLAIVLMLFVSSFSFSVSWDDDPLKLDPAIRVQKVGEFLYINTNHKVDFTRYIDTPLSEVKEFSSADARKANQDYIKEYTKKYGCKVEYDSIDRNCYLKAFKKYKNKWHYAHSALTASQLDGEILTLRALAKSQNFNKPKETKVFTMVTTGSERSRYTEHIPNCSKNCSYTKFLDSFMFNYNGFTYVHRSLNTRFRNGNYYKISIKSLETDTSELSKRYNEKDFSNKTSYKYAFKSKQ